MPSPTGDIVEVFPVRDPTVDPIAAMEYFLDIRRKVHGEAFEVPLFLEENGQLLTKNKFNKILHALMDPLLKDERDSISGHSFRSGLATFMEAANMSEEDIQAWGRWNSQAFRKYCKEGRSRSEIFSRLNKFLF